jgi:regulator of protease activity HflC (stomatin/prohibitin superfamily)
MIIYLIFIIVGGLLLAGAIVALKSRLTFVKGGERAVGTVVQLVESKDSEGTFYFPVFDIPTRQHETITYRHWTGSSSVEWQIGETKAFIFEPGKPDTVRFFNYWGIFWWPLSLMALAVDLLVIGGGYFLLRGYFGA